MPSHEAAKCFTPLALNADWDTEVHLLNPRSNDCTAMPLSRGTALLPGICQRYESPHHRTMLLLFAYQPFQPAPVLQSIFKRTPHVTG